MSNKQRKTKKFKRHGENKVAKKAEIRVEKRLRKRKQRKVNLEWHKDKKNNPISAPSIHVGVQLKNNVKCFLWMKVTNPNLAWWLNY